MSDQLDRRPGALPPLPIEELPDVSWQRIERKLFAQLASAAPRVVSPARASSGHRRTWIYAGGVLAAAAAAAVIVAVSARASHDGSVGEQASASPRSPSRIATADAPSAVSVGDVSLEIAPHSALLVDDDRARGVLFVLERGEATFRVAPVGDRPPVVVQAGDVRVEVIGTAFAVSREGDSARVLVYEGVVSLVHGGKRQRLAPGSVWPAAPAPEPALDQPADVQPEPASPPPRKPHTDRSAASAPLAAPPLTDKDRYQTAQKLEKSDPKRARALYGELVRGGGKWAPLALYAQALLADRAGDHVAARKLLQEYLARYPDGLNASDAREMLNEPAPK